MLDPDQFGEGCIGSSNDGQGNSRDQLGAYGSVEFPRNQATNIEIQLDDLIHIEELKHLTRLNRSARCPLVEMEPRSRQRAQELVLDSQDSIAIENKIKILSQARLAIRD